MSVRIVFVLDVSRSMRGVKVKTLHTETVRCIKSINDGNYVGIVSFDETARSEHNVTMITNKSIRDKLVRSVPKDYKGWWFEKTDIRAGIMEGLAAFSRARVDTKGAKIFLVTDGYHGVGNKDYVGDVLPHLKNAQVKVYCVAIGVSADPNLERLSAETGGQVFNLSRVNDKSREMMGQVMEAAMKEVITSKGIAEVVTHTVLNQVVVINGNTYEIRVPIEADIGRNTQIQVRSEAIKDIKVDITGPSGAVYTSSDGQEITKTLGENELKLCNETTESGLWTIKLTKQISSPVRAHVIVESKPTGAHAIGLRVFLSPSVGDCPPVVICKLCKGNDPIVGAIVTATVDRPGGTQTDLPLNMYHKDGYYYAYFTDYSGAGRYNVSVLAFNDNKNTTYRGTPIGPFQRQLVANCFRVKDGSMPTQRPPIDHINQLLPRKQLDTTTEPGPASNPKPISVSNSIHLLTDEMKALKSQLSANYIRTKRAVDGLQVSAKADLVNKLSAFERFFSSVRETSKEEIDGYQRQLDEINEHLCREN